MDEPVPGVGHSDVVVFPLLLFSPLLWSVVFGCVCCVCLCMLGCHFLPYLFSLPTPPLTLFVLCFTFLLVFVVVYTFSNFNW